MSSHWTPPKDYRKPALISPRYYIIVSKIGLILQHCFERVMPMRLIWIELRERERETHERKRCGRLIERKG